ncbi:phosphoribosyl-AMP cyclohydrolase, partial [Aggregatibacter actinomycetemcomitans]
MKKFIQKSNNLLPVLRQNFIICEI